jgi:P-type E1-E2 ATPase
MSLAVDQLVPGDIVLLEQGDNIPADSRLIEAFDARVNIASITGESLPKSRNAAPSAEQELINSKNILLAGTSMVSGQAKAVVFATVY